MGGWWREQQAIPFHVSSTSLRIEVRRPQILQDCIHHYVTLCRIYVDIIAAQGKHSFILLIDIALTKEMKVCEEILSTCDEAMHTEIFEKANSTYEYLLHSPAITHWKLASRDTCFFKCYIWESLAESATSVSRDAIKVKIIS